MLKRIHKAAAFTLLELMIAITVIAVGLSGVAASLYYGHIQSQHGQQIADASQYSRMMVELIQARSLIENTSGGDLTSGWPNASSGLNDTDAEDPKALDVKPFTTQDFLGYWSPGEPDNDAAIRELTRYTRKIQVERVGAVDTAEYFLARVTVTIYWENKNNVDKPKQTTTSAIISLGGAIGS